MDPRALHPRPDVHRHPADAAVRHLHLAHMEAGADLEPDRLHRVDDRLGTADRTRRSVERREEAVASVIDLATPVSGEHRPHDAVMALDELVPGSIAQRDRSLGGSHDVREQDRCERSVERGLLFTEGLDEPLELCQDGLGVPEVAGGRSRAGRRTWLPGSRCDPPALVERLRPIPFACITRVGTWIDGRTARASISCCPRWIAEIESGLAQSREYHAHVWMKS